MFSMLLLFEQGNPGSPYLTILGKHAAEECEAVASTGSGQGMSSP
jgi:hypothetical protein